jgi:NtrC-family two-component system response regulator AlgB
VNHDWPGNLRQLFNLTERLAMLAPGPLIELTDLPEEFIRTEDPPPERTDAIIGGEYSLEEVEREHIAHVLRHAESLGKAAEILAIHPVTLYRKRKRYGLIGEIPFPDEQETLGKTSAEATGTPVNPGLG